MKLSLVKASLLSLMLVPMLAIADDVEPTAQTPEEQVELPIPARLSPMMQEIQAVLEEGQREIERLKALLPGIADPVRALDLQRRVDGLGLSGGGGTAVC